jgi:hypothetical protein
MPLRETLADKWEIAPVLCHYSAYCGNIKRGNVKRGRIMDSLQIVVSALERIISKTIDVGGFPVAFMLAGAIFVVVILFTLKMFI